MPAIDRKYLQILTERPALMTDWLRQWEFDRFVTLTFNRPGDGLAHTASAAARHMRSKLRDWDARMNRLLIGKEWQRRPDNRIFHFFAPEKIAVNPHWHGLVCFYGADAKERERQGKLFDQNIGAVWSRITPAGSVDVQPMNDDPNRISYVAKSLCLELNFEHCIFPDQFWAN